MKRSVPKRADRTKAAQNKLVYKRTEIDSPAEFDFNKIFYVLAGFFVLGILYLMFFSGAFTVSSVKVEGTKEIDSGVIHAMIDKKMDSELVQKNIFLFDTDSLVQEMKKDYSLKKLKIQKEYPKGIKVTIEEYTSEMQWMSGGKYYLIDEKGRAAAVLDKKRENLPIVTDKKNLPIEIGKNLVTTDFINFIKYIGQNFSGATRGQITSIEINENFNEVNVYSSLGFYIVFDTTRDPANELNNLVTALGSNEIKSRKNLTYLDMRIKNRVFYK